jgi:hypothetical protein
LAHEPVAFERCEMCADGVVSEVQLFRELFNGARRASQDRNDLPARTLKESVIQRHRSRF